MNSDKKENVVFAFLMILILVGAYKFFKWREEVYKPEQREEEEKKQRSRPTSERRFYMVKNLIGGVRG